MKRILVALVRASLGSLFLLSLLNVPSLRGAEWPRFHGPNADNLSTETGLLSSWPQNGPRLLWKCDRIGTGVSGYSSVVISDGLLFTSGNREETSGEEARLFSCVYCIDIQNGSILWTYDNGPAWNETRNFPGTRSTPTLDGDYVYDESPLGELVCLEKKTGKKIWSRNILADFKGKTINWALAESVLIDDERLICSPGGEEASVVALEKRTGKLLWKTPATGRVASYATPYLFEHAGQKLLAVMDQKGLNVIEAETGKPHFYDPFENEFDINAAMPQYLPGHLLLPCGYKKGAKLLKLHRDETGKLKPEELWNQKFLDSQHGATVVLDGYLYGANFNGTWFCVRISDGEILWKNHGIGKGACTYADGLFYAMDEASGKVCLFQADPKGYKEISRFDLPNEGEGNFWAHPVICGKRLYLRHGVNLYCYDIAE